MRLPSFCRIRALARALILACCLPAPAAHATDFSVSPIRAELRPSAPSETITITNHSDQRLRVAVRLMAWTQDDQGQDVYAESAELVYFPRQLDLDPSGRKVVRIGVKSPPGPAERAYRLYVEEMPHPLSAGAASAVNFNFRFGVPVFVAPLQVVNDFEVLEPRLERGKLLLPVRNDGTRHVRLDRLTVSEPGGTFSQQVSGWYSLARSRREYAVSIPTDVCRRARSLAVVVEGEGIRVDRQLNVDPGHCS